MLEQELKNIWSNSSQTEHISIETSQLIKELNSKMNNIQKVIRTRDMREIYASVIGILIFGYLTYEIPFPITKLACIFSIIWFVYVIFKSIKSKKQNTVSNWSLPVTKQLEQQEITMQQQVTLLEAAAYWYSIPSFIINILFIIGLGNPSDYNWTNTLAENILPLDVNFKITLLIGLAFFYGFIIWLNKRVATKDIKPLLENIKTMQQQIRNE